MSKQSQKEAVFQAVTNVLTEAGIAVEGQVNSLMNRELRSQVNSILFEGFKKGSIDLDKQLTDSQLKTYVSSLQSNWLRKDTRLNGGVTYVAKNPGSRAGSTDAQLKNLKLLLKSLTPGTPDYVEIQSHIVSRSNEIAASRAKATTIDFSVLPAEIAAKFQK